MSRKKVRLLFFAFICVIIGVSLVFLISKNIDQENYIDSLARQRASEAVISINSGSTTGRKQARSTTSIQELGIVLSPTAQTQINGISVRLIINYQGYEKPSIAEPEINQTLIQNNWNFPVKQINYDDANSKVYVDISGIYINTTPYNFSSSLNLAIIRFNTPITFSNFQFDQNLTQITKLEGVPLKLSFSY